MTDAAARLTLREVRTARRLTSLFRAACPDRLRRRPNEAVWRLIRRRRRLLDELLGIDAERRASGVPHSAELDTALNELRREVDGMQADYLAHIETLDGEIRRRHGVGTTSGLRSVGLGRLLGRG
jgi:hypothetical protein